MLSTCKLLDVRVMGLKISMTTTRGMRLSAMVLAVSVLGACAGAPGPDGINDPYEAQNREVHEFNRGLDRAVVAPASKGYGTTFPGPVRRAVGNVARTLDIPGDITNNLLQLRVADAAQNTLRLAVNLTMGVGGIFDASTAIGLQGKPTDFGETLHVWGVGEGAYLELPFVGPSTSRDAVGMVVDLGLNPVVLVLADREVLAATVLKLLTRLGDRDRFSETVESILYDSADSYAQTRLLYLQNRRFQLGQEDGTTAGGAEDDGFIDPYEDPYAE
jgi:phospholipid-binding lipoprotein MlaA